MPWGYRQKSLKSLSLRKVERRLFLSFSQHVMSILSQICCFNLVSHSHFVSRKDLISKGPCCTKKHCQCNFGALLCAKLEVGTCMVTAPCSDDTFEVCRQFHIIRIRTYASDPGVGQKHGFLAQPGRQKVCVHRLRLVRSVGDASVRMSFGLITHLDSSIGLGKPEDPSLACRHSCPASATGSFLLCSVRAPSPLPDPKACRDLPVNQVHVPWDEKKKIMRFVLLQE